MLPGFNHNIRYKDRVFHVQTEDTGLVQQFLVTQVFIGGHLVAIEKTSYSDVISLQLDNEKRNDQIRSRMQDQHKRLLKNLVKHAYDDRIALYLGSPAADARPPPVLEAATMPVADEIPDQRHSPVSGIVKPLPIPEPADDSIEDKEVLKAFDEELQK